jgi:hypothetical protein
MSNFAPCPFKTCGCFLPSLSPYWVTVLLPGTWMRTVEHGYGKLSWRPSSTRMSWNVARGRWRVGGAFSNR